MNRTRFRSRKWMAAVGSLGFCVLCGSPHRVQVAHRNEGKGMGLKVDDCATACLCLDCHHAIDSDKVLTREKRRSEMDKAIVMTVIELARAGLIEIKGVPECSPLGW